MREGASPKVNDAGSAVGRARGRVPRGGWRGPLQRKSGGAALAERQRGAASVRTIVWPAGGHTLTVIPGAGACSHHRAHSCRVRGCCP